MEILWANRDQEDLKIYQRFIKKNYIQKPIAYSILISLA